MKYNFNCGIDVNATAEEKNRAAHILHAAFPHWGVIKTQQELSLQQEEKPLHTYYCLFLPLGIYCGFGAENIHHAYNKAAKHWGARNQIGRPYDDMPESKIQRDCRIYVFDDIKHVELTRKQVSHTLMTKLVKAWREENN